MKNDHQPRHQEKKRPLNVDRIRQAALDADVATPWGDVLEQVLQPGDVPSPVLLRPVVENVLSHGDIDLIYPERWLDAYLRHLKSVAEMFCLHMLCRAYDRRAISVKLYDRDGRSWLALDIHVRLYQLDSKRSYVTWEVLFPRSRHYHGPLEPEALDAALIYLLHLHVQRKRLDAPAVALRSALLLERLDGGGRQDDEQVQFVRSVLLDRSMLADQHVIDRLRAYVERKQAPPRDNIWQRHVGSLSRRVRRKVGRLLFAARKLFFVGADGVGKSSLIRRLNPAARVIPNSATYRGNLIYKIAKKRAKRRNDGIQASDVFPRFFFLDSLLRTLLTCLWNRGRLVFFDRSPSDIFIMRRKTQAIGLHPSARRLHGLASGFLTVHVVGVDAAGFDNPKAEMGAEQIEAYDRLTFSLMSKGRPLNYLVFRNASPIDRSAEALRRILEDSGVDYDEQ